ncbi:hypothetical protein MHPYR_880002 [uncultured Mycobacterium sp.]|uniref:Scaffolding protein n=1 Tax=uncultured Mycobacterium sp. TaxID=171292 RepID=A0A1Y5PLW4_9MYCO|nr:hypothetical protein MHPYR_880002 [uncultured Mycobacterium sp.]
MSENDTVTTEVTEEEVTAPEIAAGLEVQPEDPSDDGKAAKLRKRAQEAEAERDTLRAQLTATMDRVLDNEAERIKVNPALLRAAGLNASDYVGEDGALDIAGLAAAIEAKRAELGLPRKPQPVPSAGRGRGDALNEAGSAAWDDVFSAR